MKIDSLSHPRRAKPPASAAASTGGGTAWGRTKRIPEGKKEMIFSEFHSLLASGMDFNRAFGMLILGEKDKAVKNLLQELHREVVRGATLWQTLARSGRFTTLDHGVVRIGEETGKLHESLLFLSDYYRKKTAQRRMVSAAVSYPTVILAVALVVLVFMVLVVVPMFEQVYTRMGGELPAVTQAVIAFSRNFKSYLLAFFIVAALGALLVVLYKKTETFQRLRAAALLRIPVAGGLLKKHYQSHFCKLMYLLYSSGVPLMQGVGMLREIITFYPYQHSFGAICEGLNDGGSFAGNVERFPKLYDRKLVILLRVGEETNRLSEMLDKQADDLSAELEHRLKQLGTLLEPVLIFFVGILVAVVLISMYMPMFKLGTTIY